MSTTVPPATPGTPPPDDPAAARAEETPFSPDGELAPDQPLVQPVGGEAVEREREMLREINARSLPGRLAGYIKLSGPGWLQSALTLGGGSLTGSLYLGVLAGFGLMWLQPVAMILGIVMLSAIGYVTLSTGLRPFRAINQHINPALGWMWLLASGLANIVWALPQYSLATGVLQQNLAPDLLGGGPEAMSDFAAKALICGIILALAIVVTWSYGSGHWGVKAYELLLKVAVAAVVLCFVLVVVKLAMSGGVDWGGVFGGFVPDLGSLFNPAEVFMPALDGLRERNPAAADYWTDYIVGERRDVLMTAFATAVGINMTFLLPYSMLGRGWGREHRGLATFDLSTGMFIPFFLATSCVVIASAAAFHGQPRKDVAVDDAAYAKILAEPETRTAGDDAVLGMIDGRLKADLARAGRLTVLEEADEDGAALEAALVPLRGGVTEQDRTLAAMLVKRDAKQLSASLEPLFGGRLIADIVFGLGVLGMACSTITLLMLVSGFVVCEVLNVPATGWNFRLGALLPAIGALGPFVWKGDAAFWLAVPTSVFGLVLLPAAYVTFLLLMNKKELLGPAMPTGGTRAAINLALGLATAVSVFAAGWAVVAKVGWIGFAVIAGALAVALVVGHFARKKAVATA